MSYYFQREGNLLKIVPRSIEIGIGPAPEEESVAALINLGWVAELWRDHQRREAGRNLPLRVQNFEVIRCFVNLVPSANPLELRLYTMTHGHGSTRLLDTFTMPRRLIAALSI